MALVDPTTSAARRPDRIYLNGDVRPGVHRTASDDIFWWLPVIGPTTTVLAQTLARYIDVGGTTWDTLALAQRIGLSGNRSELWVALNRLEQFGVASFWAADLQTIRLWLPALSARQITRLPAEMADAYRIAPALPG